jgi:hypothetical protein
MYEPRFYVCSMFILAGASTAAIAGTSCTAEDGLERGDVLEYRGGYDDGHHDDGGHDDGHHDDGHHDDCEVETQPIELWPPNHELVEIDLADCIEEVNHCGHDWEAEILYVTSDEPVNDQGDGNTEPDIVCVDDDTVEVRRERQGPGDGRVYRIVFAIKDGHGHEKATSVCEVTVPHDQGQGDEAVDSGESYRVSC